MRTLSITLAIATALMSGCTSYKGAKVTEGTDLSVGISLPTTGTTLDLSVLNYLSGFHMGIDRNCNLTLKYSCTEENSYFGVIETKKTRQIDSTVTPATTPHTQPSASTAHKDAQDNTTHIK
jgi:hypothetical protein